MWEDSLIVYIIGFYLGGRIKGYFSYKFINAKKKQNKGNRDRMIAL